MSRILRLEVLRRDGTRAASHRVFCQLRRESVPLDTCSSCGRCDAILTAPPSVVCTAPIAPDASHDRWGERTEIGAVLSTGGVAVSPETPLGDAFALMRAENCRALPVIETTSETVIGVLHEPVHTSFVRIRDPRGRCVRDAMSIASVLPEVTPVRQAIYFLASAHLREVTVVTVTGGALGVFRDVDGLTWLAKARKDRTEATL